MNEIDHEAAKACATKIIEANEWLESNGFGKLSGGNLSRAYLDLHAQLAAERERVEALAELVYVTAEQASKLSYHDLKTKITAIINAQGEVG